MRGITLRQLERILATVRARCAAGSRWWTITGDGRWEAVAVAEDKVTLYHFNSTLLKPLTKIRGSSGATICSLVELMADSPQPPAAFVSHWWGEPIAHFVACIRQYARDRSYGADTPFWVCAYANNQHAVALGSNPSQSPFVEAIRQSRGMVAIVDREARMMRRVWCAFEAYMALVGPPARPPADGGEEGGAVAASTAGYLYDIYTFSRAGDGGSAGGAVERLTDGTLAGELTSAKMLRERSFPPELAMAALAFRLATSEASQVSDHAAISACVGERAAALEATLAARYAVASLPALRAHPEVLAEGMRSLRSSALRKLALDLDLATAGSDGGAAYGLPAGWVASELLPNLPESLVILSLPSCGVDAPAAAALASRLPSLARLQELDLSSNDLSESAAFSLLARALPSARALTVLDLSSAQLGDSGARALGGALAQMAALQTVELRQNGIGGAGAADLFSAWLSACRGARLRALSVRENPLGDAGMAALGEALAASSFGDLTSLNVAGCACGAAGARALARALAQSSLALGALTLVLDGNPLGDDGAIGLCEALPDLPVRGLSLSSVTCAEAGVRALAAAVGESRALRTLALRYNSLGPSSFVMLAGALARSRGQLAELNLSWNDAGDEGAEAFAAALEATEAPCAVLNLNRNSICAAGAHALARALLKTRAPVRSLRLRANTLGPGGCAALRDAASKMRAPIANLELDGSEEEPGERAGEASGAEPTPAPSSASAAGPLAAAAAAVAAAHAQLDSVRRGDYGEVTSMTSPSPSATLVLSALCILLGLRPDGEVDDTTGRVVANFCKIGQAALRDPSALRARMREVDSGDGRVPPTLMARVRTEYISNAAFDPVKMRVQSLLLAHLCAWVLAVNQREQALADDTMALGSWAA